MSWLTRLNDILVVCYHKPGGVPRIRRYGRIAIIQLHIRLYLTVALMAVVTVACTALCFAWTIPSWRRHLAGAKRRASMRCGELGALNGWFVQRADADRISSYSYSAKRYSYSYSMAFRTAAEAIIGRDGCNGCGSTLGTAILSDDEYEYRSSAFADSLSTSTSTKQSTNKTMHQSPRSTGLICVESTPRAG